MKRSIKNPLITIHDIKPSHPDLKVDGVFNCGAVLYQKKYMLLLRVAESAKTTSGFMQIPALNSQDQLMMYSIDKNDEHLTFDDSRTIKNKNGNVAHLTSLSHFRKATSTDGIHFKIDDKPWIFPKGQMESWGIEDPRITSIENKYLITYTAVSPNGVAVGLIETKDFETFERHGLILPVDNKDVSILPEKIDGKYYMYHRPIPKDIGHPNMWVASSPDLIHWGHHALLLMVSKDGWDSGRIGGGAPSVKTPKGWLHIYHAATPNNVYALGAFLTPLDNPTKIIAKTLEPILSPEAVYEKEGFFGGVVFTCGLILEKETLLVYYGAADDKICLATIELKEIYEKMTAI